LCANGHTIWFGGRFWFGTANTASASIIAHEYGHYALRILATTGRSAAFDEGYADTYSILLNDDPIIGRQHVSFETHVRDDPLLAGCTYPIPSDGSGPCPCTPSGGHSAGQLLSGIWTWILNEYKSHYGDDVGLERARQFFVDWTLLTLGGEDYCNGGYPGTEAELASVLVETGYFNEEWDMVCDAVTLHDIPCTH
jgi:hypothetical protein